MLHLFKAIRPEARVVVESVPIKALQRSSLAWLVYSRKKERGNMDHSFLDEERPDPAY